MEGESTGKQSGIGRTLADYDVRLRVMQAQERQVEALWAIDGHLREVRDLLLKPQVQIDPSPPAVNADAFMPRRPKRADDPRQGELPLEGGSPPVPVAPALMISHPRMVKPRPVGWVEPRARPDLPPLLPSMFRITDTLRHALAALAWPGLARRSTTEPLRQALLATDVVWTGRTHTAPVVSTLWELAKGGQEYWWCNPGAPGVRQSPRLGQETRRELQRALNRVLKAREAATDEAKGETP